MGFGGIFWNLGGAPPNFGRQFRILGAIPHVLSLIKSVIPQFLRGFPTIFFFGGGGLNLGDFHWIWGILRGSLDSGGLLQILG